MGPQHVLERVVRASRHRTSRHQPRAVVLKKFGDLLGISHRRPLSPRHGLGSSSASSAGWRGRLFAAHSERHTTHGGEYVCPHATAFRTVQHAAGVHKLSVGASIGRPHTSDLRIPTRVLWSQTAKDAESS